MLHKVFVIIFVYQTLSDGIILEKGYMLRIFLREKVSLP